MEVEEGVGMVAGGVLWWWWWWWGRPTWFGRAERYSRMDASLMDVVVVWGGVGMVGWLGGGCSVGYQTGR